MKTKSIITLLLKSILNILINYTNTLFENRDFLFKLELSTSYNLDIDDDILIYIIDSTITFI